MCPLSRVHQRIHEAYFHLAIADSKASFSVTGLSMIFCLSLKLPHLPSVGLVPTFTER